jgi:hypothetical protein
MVNSFEIGSWRGDPTWAKTCQQYSLTHVVIFQCTPYKNQPFYSTIPPKTNIAGR